MRGDSSTLELPLFQGEDGGSSPTSPLQLTGTLNGSNVVGRIIDYGIARSVIVNNHYSRTMPCCELPIGFDIDGKLNCVVIYGKSATSRMAGSLPGPYLELTRLFSFDWSGKNTESYCIGQSILMVKKLRPDIKVLISFADPSQGHVGTIYQATNWLYCGVSDQTGGYTYFIDGKWQHPRSTVARFGTRNHKEILQKIPDVQFKRIPRKHRYIMLLGSKSERKAMKLSLKYPILPYPKKLA